MIRVTRGATVAFVCLFVWMAGGGAIARAQSGEEPAIASATAFASDHGPSFGAAAGAKATVPSVVRFSGVLQDGAGTALTGVQGVTFALYEEQTGGAPLWLETQNVTFSSDGAADGKYTVLLGSQRADGLPLDLFTSNEARWLGVRPNIPEAVEQARVLLVSVPYALKAADAETLGGKPLSAFVLNAISDSKTPPTASAGDVLPTAAVTSQNFVVKTVDGIGTPGDSQIFDNGTAIGIGTTAPGTLTGMDVHGVNANLVVGGTGTHSVAVQGDASNGRLGQDSEGFFFASDSEGKVLKFLTTDAGSLNEWMRIDRFGNIGLGTKLPASKLHVEGSNAGLTLSGAGAHALVLTGSANTARVGQDSQGLFLFSDTPGKHVRFGVGGFEMMRLTSGVGGPYLGIGTSSPLAALHVEGQFAHMILSGDGDHHRLMFRGSPHFGSVGTDGNGVLLSAETPGTALRFLTNNGTQNEWMRITSTGSVGIGTTSPAGRLEVSGGDMRVSGGGRFVGDGSGLTNLPATGLSGIGTANSVPKFTAATTLGNSQITDTGTNVGIGTAAPTAKLHVVGDLRVTGDYIGNISSTGTLALPNTTDASTGVLTLGGIPFLHNFTNTTPVTNVFLGPNAGSFTMHGQSNIGIGWEALHSVVDASQNTAVGTAALRLNTGGYNNTALGFVALTNNSTGSHNTVLGYGAMELNTTGGVGGVVFQQDAGNTAIGANALQYNTTGDANTAVGQSAGRPDPANGIFSPNVSGSRNTFLGAQSGPGTTTPLTNATAIGHNAAVSASNALVLGSISGINGAVADVNVGIGTAAPTAKLHVVGDVLSTGTVTASAFSGGSGGFKLAAGGAKPTCDANVRGTIWATLDGVGMVNDNIEVCLWWNGAFIWRAIGGIE